MFVAGAPLEEVCSECGRLGDEEVELWRVVHIWVAYRVGDVGGEGRNAALEDQEGHDGLIAVRDLFLAWDNEGLKDSLLGWLSKEAFLGVGWRFCYLPEC
jgi:hypothetical protein